MNSYVDGMVVLANHRSLISSAKLFVVAGPSGVGKTTVVNRLLAVQPENGLLQRAITYTSRQQRFGEVNGIDYHFITPELFEAYLGQDFFLEWSGAYGTYYGTPRAILEQQAAGVSSILVIDRLGARQVIDKVPGAVLVWLTVPDITILVQRLQGRGTESHDVQQKRLALAQQEIEEELKKPLFSYHIYNVDIEKTVRELKSIIDSKLS